MKYYTMIGSRLTPVHCEDLMKRLSHELCRLHYTVRSGGANGADTCAEYGFTNLNSDLHEVYLPWSGFNNKSGIVYSKLGLINEASELCSKHHLWWNTVKKESVKHLHRRNMHQVLGKDLITPSQFCILYAEPDTNRGEGHVKGGTGSANSLCLEQGVPVYNLYYDDVYSKLLNWVIRQEQGS